MLQAVSMSCGVSARVCLHMWLPVSSSDLNCSCLLRWSMWITTLDRSLPWSPYLQCACSIEFYRSLFWSPILSIQHPALPTPHTGWFMVGIRSGKFLYWSSFSVTALVGGYLRCWFLFTGLPWNPSPCCVGYLHRAPANLCLNQFAGLSIGNEFKLYKTNQLHVAVYLFSNRSHRMSKYGNDVSETLAIAWCATFLFLPHFDIIYDLLLNWPTAKRNLFINLMPGKFAVNFLLSVPLPSSQVTLWPPISGAGGKGAQRWMYSTSSNVLYTGTVYLFVKVLVFFFCFQIKFLSFCPFPN